MRDGASPGLRVVAGDALLGGVFGSAAAATASPITLRAVLRTPGSAPHPSGRFAGPDSALAEPPAPM